MADLRHLTENDFDRAVTSDTPVLVDFYTTWCGPCRALAPVLEKMAVDLKGRVEIAKVNVEEEFALGARFGVSAVPTLMIFKGGEVVDVMVGMPRPEDLRKRLENHAPARAA